MKKTHITIGLILFGLLISCISNQIESVDKLVLKKSYRNDTIWKTDSLMINKSLENDTLRFIYKQKLDTLAYSFSKSIKNDSSIHLYGQNCFLVSQKKFKIGNENIEISRYYYDVENSVDEESSFFYHKDYGILVCFNDGWSDLIFSVEHDNKSKILIDSIINDRTGFYRMNIPPPPPFSDSLIIEID